MRRSRQSKARLIWMGIAVLCLLIALVFFGLIQAIRASQQSQQAALRWQGESDQPFVQLSLYLSEDAGFSANQAASLNQSIQSALDAISNTDNWYACHSTETRLTLNGPAGSIQAQATAAGGAFFRMRGFNFLSGSGFTEEDFTPDRIVLDQNAAWQLFGSDNVAGQVVTFGDRELPVAGVVDSRHLGMFDGTEETAYGSRPRVYIPFSLLEQLNEVPVITCYEAVIPEPIRDFASTTVMNNLPLDKNDTDLVINSRRYSFIPLFSTIGGLWIRSMRTSRIVYPWWENTAGVAEDFAALCQLFMVIFLGAGVIILSVFLIRFFQRHPPTLRPLRSGWEALHDRRIRRAWEKKQAKKQQQQS